MKTKIPNRRQILQANSPTPCKSQRCALASVWIVPQSPALCPSASDHYAGTLMCVPYLTVPRRSSDSCFSRPSYCLLRVGNLTLTGMCALWPGSPVYMGPALMMSFFVCSTNSYLCTSDHLVLHMQLHHLSVFTYGITLICETIENTNTIKPIPQS